LGDGAFWCLLVYLAPYGLVGYSIISALRPQGGSDSTIAVIVAVIICSYPALLFWIAWDSYRWGMPNRALLLAACVLFGWLGAGYYLGMARPERQMQVERERAEAERRAG
jgi:hypothetical protein